MNFDLYKSIELLRRSPIAYKALFYQLDTDYGNVNEGENTWSAFDIIGHLIHGEKTDWIPRARIILDNSIDDKVFEPYDRFAQEILSKGKSLDELLLEFEQLRKDNIDLLKSWNLDESQLNKTGIHPELGEVTLKQLIATWAIHDMSHLHQVSRVIVKHYHNDVGPWAAYSSILKKASKK